MKIYPYVHLPCDSDARRDLATANKGFFYNGSMTQLFIAHLLADVEIFTLNQYAAIVKFMPYMVITNEK